MLTGLFAVSRRYVACNWFPGALTAHYSINCSSSLKAGNSRYAMCAELCADRDFADSLAGGATEVTDYELC